MKNVDWEQIARQIGSIQENTPLGRYSELGGSNFARKALIEILGEDLLRDAVDYYVDGGRGSEVIRSILRLIQPRSAMDRCYDIYKSNVDIETRRYALTLLVHFADYSVLNWIYEFLDDPDEDINIWGACTLDQLLQTHWEAPPQEFGDLLDKAEKHSSQRVREQTKDLRIRERLEDHVWLK
jgi:hypothetical protein